MLTDFYIAMDDFDAARKECGPVIAQCDKVTGRSGNQMGALGGDMISFRDSFVRSHMAAAMWHWHQYADALSPRMTMTFPDHETWMAYCSGGEGLDEAQRAEAEQHIERNVRIAKEMGERSRARSVPGSGQALAELKAVYKAYFFFVRAYQDACYWVLLELTPGCQPGKGSKMAHCCDPDNLASNGACKEVAAVPGYVAWFRDFRDKRNLIKEGVSFSLRGSPPDLRVAVDRFPEKGRLEVDMSDPGFGIADLIEAFRYSTKLTRRIAAVAS